jgi:hypothetical protein
MNRYLEKIALHQEPVDQILDDHNEKYYEIESSLEDHLDDFDRVHNLYKHDSIDDPRRDALVREIRQMKEDRLRDDLDIDGQHHENNLITAKRLMALKGMEHFVNDDNASNIVGRFEQALGSNHSNPSAIWKGLGTAASAIGGAVAGGALTMAQMGRSPWILGGAALGAYAGGKIGSSALGGLLDDKIEARRAANYNAREDAIESAFERLKSRYSVGH